jgi:hypothetical protein
VDHLFLHFDFAYGLWNVVFSAFGLHWVRPRTVVELIWVVKPVLVKAQGIFKC